MTKSNKEIKEPSVEDKALIVEPEDHHLVTYTNGERIAELAAGGYGYHSYLYKEGKPKQGAGAKSTPTAGGYRDGKEARKDAVTVLKYYDSWCSKQINNGADGLELSALIEVLTLAATLKLKSLLLTVSSEYVSVGLKDRIEISKSEDESITDSKRANTERWSAILGCIETLLDDEVEIEVYWAQSSTDSLGSSLSTIFANRGVHMTHKGIYEVETNESEPKGYWSAKIEFNRMLSKSMWYFNTNIKNGLLSSDGRHIYHLGRHGAEDSMLGKKMSESSYSVIYLNESNPVLETMRVYQDELTGDNSNKVIVCNLDAVKQPQHYSTIRDYGTKYLHSIDDGLHVIADDKVLLTSEMRPARLAFRAIDMLSTLELMLEEYLNIADENKRPLTVTDITSEIYDVSISKSGKETYKLKKEIGTAVRNIKSIVAYDTGKYSGDIEANLLFNMDLPSRNTLSAIATSAPKIKVITWPESNEAIRIATIVESDKDVGIWSSVYSNLRILES